MNTPLVVDLDGTLTATDTLVESVIQLMKQSPFNLLRLPVWLLKGRAASKTEVALRATIEAANLPYRPALLEYLQTEKARGRKIILATAAHRSIAESVAKYLGLFDVVLASDAEHNLKGRAKLHAIQAAVGSTFMYAGDSTADIPIWQAAQAAVLVNVSASLAALVRQQITVEKEFPKEQAGISAWLKALVQTRENSTHLSRTLTVEFLLCNYVD